jgi:hypothetical protein
MLSWQVRYAGGWQQKLLPTIPEAGDRPQGPQRQRHAPQGPHRQGKALAKPAGEPQQPPL